MGQDNKMADYPELVSRISAALDRVGSSLDRQPVAQSDTSADEARALKEALEAERNANAQLEERVLAIKEKQEKVVARLEEEVMRLREEADRALQEMQQLRAANAQLRENNKALREANASGVGDTDLINSGLQAELAALRARRDADRQELDVIISELKPLLEGAQNA